MDGDAGDWGSGSTEALKASDIPPWAAIDTKADSTQNPIDFIATLRTSPLCPDIASPCKWPARVKYCPSPARSKAPFPLSLRRSSFRHLTCEHGRPQP
jgi:hypothetical protein